MQQNPHFYLDLPTTKDAYGAGFFKDSTKEFKFKGNDTVYVLVDKPDLSRVYLEAEKRKRIFGNVWRPNDVMIFKGEPNITRSKFASPHIWQIFVGGQRASNSLEMIYKGTKSCSGEMSLSLLSTFFPPHRGICKKTSGNLSQISETGKS